MANLRVTVARLRTHLLDVLKDVEEGGDVTVVRGQRVVARVVPADTRLARLRAVGWHPAAHPLRRVRPVKMPGGQQISRAIVRERG